jgi:tRNA(His) 5'-end guanylyltransferase
MPIDPQRFRTIEAVEQRVRLPGAATVVRLDGRGFSRLTKETDAFARPFDEGFRDAMLATAVHLFECGFRVEFGYTQSDEISLLLHVDDETFGRRIDKTLSVLSGEASAALSLRLGMHAVFDARILQLAREEEVVDYFVWRSLDAHRNALSAHAYWALRDQDGLSATAATRRLRGSGVADKNDLLFARGTNFNEVPAWQKRGVALFWESYDKVGVDPRSGQERVAERRRVAVDMDLPLGDAWRAYVQDRGLRTTDQPA